METYKNPFALPKPGSSGDPFVMRFDGSYYLYCSAGAPPSYLYCWKSEDLVDWTHMGVACDLPEICGGYAPEVIYTGGKFYMCTAPHGAGHYLLRADRPEGPYTIVTQRFGQAIDGSFFIDDNGDSYFLRAENTIRYHTMPDPETVSLPGTPIPETKLEGWTEGPMVLRHGGKYFLTYTGHHILSKGYKVAYSVSDTSPVSGYVNMKNRVVLLETGDDFHALGHSSNCLAPDMDGACIVYQSFERVKEPLVRYTNVDRLFFNGARMYANTIWWEQEKPAAPVYTTRGTDALLRETRGDQHLLLTGTAAPDVYTAEINLDHRGAEAILVYADGDGQIRLSGHTVTVSEKGSVRCAGELPKNICPDSLNAYRFSRRADGRMELQLNNNQQFLHWDSAYAGGRIGLVQPNGDAAVGFIGISAYAGGSSDKTARKGIPGRMDAVHGEEEHETVSCRENGMEIFCVRTKAGMRFSYPVHVKRDGEYFVTVHLRDAREDAAFLVNGTHMQAPAPLFYDRDGSAKVVLGTVFLRAGTQKVVLESESELTADSFEFTEAQPMQAVTAVTGGQLSPEMEIFGWKHGLGLVPTCYGVSCARGWGIGFFGEHGWRDYEITARVNGIRDCGGACDILVRLQKESFHTPQIQTAAFGYSVRVDGSNILLTEWFYGEKVLVSYAHEKAGAFSCDITVRVQGQLIEVSLDGHRIFSYPIPMGNVSGRPGMRITGECFGFTEFCAEPITEKQP